ncbi:hypothetical protein I4U23_015010 [Adineta vaga]|nr:hypothetical protein I4U23_015010 [Adineta vaga]
MAIITETENDKKQNVEDALALATQCDGEDVMFDSAIEMAKGITQIPSICAAILHALTNAFDFE